MQLYKFQLEATTLLADRIVSYLQDPIEVGQGGQVRRIPYVQFLSSITASGKTIMLADAVSLINKQLPVPPVILWLSRATVVVEQSFSNLDAGGPYNAFLDGAEVRYLSDLASHELAESPSPFVYFATVGLFNRADREKGLKVFRSSIDETDDAAWDELKRRPNSNQIRRPLLVVYDEAHNLSDQQTELLLELEPDAFLLATATARLPARFDEEVVTKLKSLGSAELSDLTVTVPASEVAESGLIKTEVELVGHQAPASTIISEMYAALAELASEATMHGLQGTPKAVYVCKTNVVEGSDERDNPAQTFIQRQAPPILIWRHLTEKLGVEPSKIAVYCNLATDRNFPLPGDFNLFAGGDRDYGKFTSGDYQHVIFNKTLQEGWDDPLVYFAYIDKSMGSAVQTEQVIGRLLRQPGRRHYPSATLNRAMLHVRVDAAGVFEQVVDDVNRKIQSDGIPIQFRYTKPGAKRRVDYPSRGEHLIPRVATPADEAEHAIETEITAMNDFRTDLVNTVGQGRRTRVQRLVGGGEGQPHYEWEDVGESAQVVVRWLFGREVRKVHPLALSMVITGNADGTPSKFDALVGFGSNAAAHVKDIAEKVGKAYVDNVYLKLTKPNPFKVGNVSVDVSSVETFNNSVHSGYSDLNPTLELPFCRALDRTGRPWYRNPSQVGYSIPLVQPGRTKSFFPDFVVWHEGDIYAIDTKGAHLSADARRKLTSIRPATGDSTRVFIRFVSNGKINDAGPTPDGDGFTSWTFKPNGEPKYVHVETMDEAVAACLKPDAG